MKAPILLALTLFLAACDSGPVNHSEEASKALQARDYGAAVSHFDQALAALGPDSPERTEIALARCGARAHQDVKAARGEFLEIAASEDLKEKAYKDMVRNLFNAGSDGLLEAVIVVDAGIKKFPDSEGLMAYLEKLKAEAAKAEGGALNKALQGLGYS